MQALNAKLIKTRGPSGPSVTHKRSYDDQKDQLSANSQRHEVTDQPSAQTFRARNNARSSTSSLRPDAVNSVSRGRYNRATASRQPETPNYNASPWAQSQRGPRGRGYGRGGNAYTNRGHESGMSYRGRGSRPKYEPNEAPSTARATAPKQKFASLSAASTNGKRSGYRGKREAVAYNPDEVDMTRKAPPRARDVRPAYGDNRLTYSSPTRATRGAGLSSRGRERSYTNWRSANQ